MGEWGSVKSYANSPWSIGGGGNYFWSGEVEGTDRMFIVNSYGRSRPEVPSLGGYVVPCRGD